MWKRGEIAPQEQFLLFSTIFCYVFLDFHVKTGTRISLRYKRLFEISEVEITRVDCILKVYHHSTLSKVMGYTFILTVSFLKWVDTLVLTSTIYRIPGIVQRDKTFYMLNFLLLAVMLLM